MRSCHGCSLLVLLLFLAVPGTAITQGQVDRFDADAAGWTSGGANPNPPVFEPDGGPRGAGDGFLRVLGNGGAGAGGNLIAFNTAQWSGDWLAAGVVGLSASLANLGDSDLAVRLLIEGPGGDFLSAEAVTLPAGAGWTPAAFPVRGDTLVDGRDLAATLAGVTKLRILHAPGMDGAEPVAGALGVDDLAALAVPEPAGALVYALGLALLASRLRC